MADNATPAWDESRVAHRYAQLDQVRLHYVEAGDGPLVLLLHGFPEFWYSWRFQILPLAEAGFRVVAPDLRGYNLSDKPKGVANYRVERVADDIDQLVDHLGHTAATVIGHDWGGMTAWVLAMRHPNRVQRLGILNCPHPAHAFAMLKDPAQVRRSWYMLFFQLPFIPERSLRRDRFKALRRLLQRDPEREGAFSSEDIERYVEVFSTGSLSPALNYYRALFRSSLWRLRVQTRSIEVPTRVIWGVQDSALGRDYAEPPRKLVPNHDIHYLDDASHWVQVDRPHRVNRLLLEFLDGS